MREILISTAVFVSCLMVAFISQLVSPSTVIAATPSTMASSNATTVQAAVVQAVANPMELDPDNPNPTLFAMAPDTNIADASALGGPMEAEKPQVTASGLKITDLVVGTGDVASSGQNVVVNYRGTLEDGTQFDASYDRGTPFEFPLGAGRVIKGWDEGVQGMKVGGKRKLVIPPDLGYGKRGAGRVIPPNATLIFEVELLDIKR
ncbi:FKBP-type peptidyl-prolyl cis-trans isomerase [Synechococcus sp. ROS8604]|uniref:FKBP-type peptidyl-prolyl cis-trans isomerase n=1 Tax=Synechococcus sp. ROS8604 TaxID=1442557 RepID=UPI001646E399|nr:FKBP-type peptidyl-prolyl cis-trans isomerase [Synechococcus sp. ROS8604]QNI87624.1 FKBP-type peptidyl-prolyl cis-trans isomerase [Synechococcus sp. ROS8604]